MTRTSLGTLGLSAAALVALLCTADARQARAQCCAPAPTVAYSPVVVQPQTTIVRTGWYPGYLLDRLRMRRWAANTTTVAAVPAVAAAPTYSVGYAPAYTAAYAPAYTAAYAPAAYTAGYSPYITGYAPLQTPVVQTSYAVPTAVPAVSSGCSTCPTTTTVAYAPSTVYRPVELTPVVSTAACDPCSTGSTVVGQASYVEGAAPADCPGCAVSAGAPQYYPEASSMQPQPAPPAEGPPTPEPTLEGTVPPPQDRFYPPTGAEQPQAEPPVPVPGPAPDDATGPEADPAGNTDNSTFFDFQAPPLLAPQNDRTANNRPTVDIQPAVFTRPARQATRVSTTAAKPVAPSADANGWYAVD